MPHKRPAKIRTTRRVKFPKGATGLGDIRTGRTTMFPRGATGMARIGTGRKVAPIRRKLPTQASATAKKRAFGQRGRVKRRAR